MKLSSLFAGIFCAASLRSALACSACFGKSDSALAQGMNWGIFSLLAVIIPVLGGVAGFFVYLAKRSAALESATLGCEALPSESSIEPVPSKPDLIAARD